MIKKILEHFDFYQNKKIFGIITIIAILAALPITVIVSQKQQETRQRASEIVSSPFPPSSVKKITSCGSINKNGNYVMDADINATGNGCLNIENVNDVKIDCKGHSIILDQNSPPTDTDPFRPLLGVKNVKNFSINSCILKVINSPYAIT